MKQTAALLLFTLFLFGCNTVEGIGKDIGALGNSIEKAADKKGK
jgi:predicted small secreted protein